MDSRQRPREYRGDSGRVDLIGCGDRGDVRHEPIQMSVDGVTLETELTVPPSAKGLVLVAHDRSCSRHRPGNQLVAWKLQAAGLGTLLINLRTREEEVARTYDRNLRLEVRLLAQRLMAATVWSATHSTTRDLSLGYFGASTGAAAALIAASWLGRAIAAVVTRDGWSDLASPEITRVVSPTLFMMGSRDERGVELNRNACTQLAAETQLAVLPHAADLLQDQVALSAVALRTTAWFQRHLVPACAPGTLPVA